MKTLLLAGTALIALSTASLAATTGVTGGSLSFDNHQPSLVTTVVTPFSGIFPSGDGGGSANGDTLASFMISPAISRRAAPSRRRDNCCRLPRT